MKLAKRYGLAAICLCAAVLLAPSVGCGQGRFRFIQRFGRNGPFHLLGGGEYYHPVGNSANPSNPSQDDPLDAARAAIEAGRLASARGLLQRARRSEENRSTLADLQTQLDQAARAQMDRAERLCGLGQPRRAMAVFNHVALAMGDSPIGLQARERWNQIKTDPKTEQAEAENLAAAKWEAVVDSLDGRPALTKGAPRAEPSFDDLVGEIRKLPIDLQANVVTAVQDLIDRHPDSPTARKAMELHLRLVADTDIVQNVDAWRAAQASRHLFDKARMYHRARLLPRARQCYLEFIQTYPRDPRRKEAGEYLARIRQSPGAVTE